MYDGTLPFQIYNDIAASDDGEFHVMSNLFTATAEFYDANPEAIEAFLVLWQRGIELWEQNKAEIIETYPQHFAVEEDEDIAFIQDFMSGDNDWFVDSVYLTDEWIESETKIWQYMTELNPDNQNYLDPGFSEPRFEAIAPPA
jgi:hypothetical protein